MTLDELKDYLNLQHVEFEERPVSHGTQLRCKPSGEIFVIYGTGKINVQGKATDLSRIIETWAKSGVCPAEVAAGAPSTSTPPINPAKTVFIVYGHNVGVRDALELELRRFGLNPIILQNLPANGDTIIEKLEQYIGENGNVGYACVLLTPDDEGYRVGTPEEKKYRARQNVILELGMVLAKLGRRRVAILHKESVELPSNIGGLIYISYKERIEEIRYQLFQELQAAGYNLSSAAL